MDDSSGAFRRIGEIIDKADSYDSTGESLGVIETQHDVFAKVWGDAKALRTSGEMVEMGNLIECPVVAIHGDHDPHPVEGVEAPLRKTVKDFRIIVLEKCGHIPWIEKHAKDEFYRILREEIRN